MDDNVLQNDKAKLRVSSIPSVGELDLACARHGTLTQIIRRELSSSVVAEAFKMARRRFEDEHVLETAFSSIRKLSGECPDKSKTTILNRRQIFEVGFRAAVMQAVSEVFPVGVRTIGTVSFKENKKNPPDNRVRVTTEAAYNVFCSIIRPLQKSASCSLFKTLPVVSLLGVIFVLFRFDETRWCNWWTCDTNTEFVCKYVIDLYPGYLATDAAQLAVKGVKLFQKSTKMMIQSCFQEYAERDKTLISVRDDLMNLEKKLLQQIENGCDEKDCLVLYESEREIEDGLSLLHSIDPFTARIVAHKQKVTLNMAKKIFSLQQDLNAPLKKRSKKSAGDLQQETKNSTEGSAFMPVYFQDGIWYSSVLTTELICAVIPIWCELKYILENLNDSELRKRLNAMRAIDCVSDLQEDEDIIKNSEKEMWTAIRFSMLLHNDAEVIKERVHIKKLSLKFMERLDEEGNISSKDKTRSSQLQFEI